MPAEGAGTAALVQAGGERTGPLRIRPEAQVRGPGSPDCRRPRGPPPIGGIGQAGAETLVARVDRPLTARFGILDLEQANVGQSELTRVEHLDGDDLAPAPEPRQRRAPGVDGRDEVRDDDREPAPSQDVAKTVDGATQIDLTAERRPGDLAQQGGQMTSTAADRDDAWPIGAGHDRADTVAAEDGELRHGRGDIDGQIGLPPADGPEVKAARPVDQDGDVEVALHDGVPDVGLTGPGKDRPIHPPDVIARLVGSRFSGLDTVAKDQ